jgi:isochorismate hydrolase
MPRSRSSNPDLHGNAPDDCPVALLVIDMINAFEFDGAEKVLLLAHLGASTLILTGVAANNCVLFTAHDAYMRDFRLLVPRDCVAAENASDERYALEHMKKVLKADTSASAGIDLAALSKSCTAGTSRSSRS